MKPNVKNLMMWFFMKNTKNNDILETIVNFDYFFGLQAGQSGLKK